LLIHESRAVVTGAARGIGRCLALELVRAGAQVVAGDIQAEPLRTLEKDAAGMPGRISTGSLDVSQETSVTRFLGDAFNKIGAVNLLVNNAGILRDGLLVQKEEDGLVRKMPTAQWRSVIDVNLTGPYLMTREVVAQMLERDVRPALIVNISSISGAGNAGQSNYAASKAGLDALTRTWSLELAPHGIRVAGIAPGLIDTPMTERISPEARSHILQQTLGRMGQPMEIWQSLRFLIECDFFTGRTVSVDGGANF
jgi:3-oxoacyl-[acyl-carrier protein] reductase